MKPNGIAVRMRVPDCLCPALLEGAFDVFGYFSHLIFSYFVLLRDLFLASNAQCAVKRNHCNNGTAFVFPYTIMGQVIPVAARGFQRVLFRDARNMGHAVLDVDHYLNSRRALYGFLQRHGITL